MKKHITIFLGLLFFQALFVRAQTGDLLQAGDKAPSLVLSAAMNSIQSYTFPYKKKMVFVFFWSSDIAASKQQLYTYAKLNKRYSRMLYKEADGFEMISVALQPDAASWQKDITRYNLKDMNNGIAKNGFQDMYVQQYKIKSVPASYLIDEFGKILLVNPDAASLEAYLEDARNASGNESNQNRIAGNILYGQEELKPMMHKKIYVTDAKNDTIQTVETNNTGHFEINNVNRQSDITIKMGKSEDMKKDDNLFLASESGDVVSEFKKTDRGFEYRLLPIDIISLKPLKEEEVNMSVKKSLPELYFSENLFKSGGYNLTPESAAKVDQMVQKLKADPSIKVDVFSHTDSKGDSDFNKTLSEKRANAILKYMLSKGVDKNRVRVFGRGEEEPLNTCIDGVPCTDKEYEVNRRTEFRFYKME